MLYDISIYIKSVLNRDINATVKQLKHRRGVLKRGNKSYIIHKTPPSFIGNTMIKTEYSALLTTIILIFHLLYLALPQHLLKLEVPLKQILF